MKYAISILLIAVMFSSCADSKTFIIEGKKVKVDPYGWMCKDLKNDSINYEINTGNIVWSVILCETLIAPLLLTGLELYEPVSKKVDENTNESPDLNAVKMNYDAR